MIEAKVVIVADPFMAVLDVLAEHGVAVVTLAELLDAAPTNVVDSDDDEHDGDNHFELIH